MEILHNHKSQNYDERPGGDAIEYLILHYTAGNFDLSLKWLTMAETPNRVSSHYLICENGKIYNLVDESKRAWHAGVSFWDGQANLNARSIGIELVNPGHGPDYCDFPEAQLSAALALSQSLVECYQISPFHVLGHSDIAPGRKIDPGEKFAWNTFAKKGVGIMPPEILPKHPCNHKELGQKLIAFGYDPTADFETLLDTFQMHYGGSDPDLVSAKLDWLLQQKSQQYQKRKSL